MDPKTPPPPQSEPHRTSKSSSRLSNKEDPIPHLDLATDSPKQSTKLIPLRELLLLSPSPQRRYRTRLIERPEMAEEPVDLVIPRRRCKGRGSPMGVLNCASPRINRRSRRRLDQEIREEKEFGPGEEILINKPRKRRQAAKRKEKPGSSIPSSRTDEIDQSSLDYMKHMVCDLVMWKDVAKSTLWFGFGSMCILSSCFANGLRWSIFSMISQLGLIFLAVSFFYNSISKRNKDAPKMDFKLKEEDIVRVARVFLPAANLAIVKTREIFSGDPSTTLRVAPFLLFGAEYGHIITLWRLCAIGFLLSFTVPKLFSCYSDGINRQVEYLTSWISEAWVACSHKKAIAISVGTVFWNLSSVKTRIFAAFLSTVILRYRHQKSESEIVETILDEQSQEPGAQEPEPAQEEENQENRQSLVVVENGSRAK